MNTLDSTRTSVVVESPRAYSSYEGKRLEVRMEYTGPVHENSNKLYFEYTGNPNVSNILPQRQLVTLVNMSFCVTTSLTLSPPIPLKLYTLPYWSNPPFLIFDIWVLWRSGMSARAPECQKLKMMG